MALITGLPKQNIFLNLLVRVLGFLTAICCVQAQSPIPFGLPVDEEHYIHGQLTTSPFSFQPGIPLNGNQDCLTNSSISTALVVTTPCLTASSNTYAALQDKWTFNFTDSTLRPWVGAQTRQPTLMCLDAGSLNISPGEVFVGLQVSIATCNSGAFMQKWQWDAAFLKISDTVAKDRWFARDPSDTTHFRLTSDRTRAVPLNFVLPPYSGLSTYTVQPATVHSQPAVTAGVLTSNIGDGPGPCVVSPHRAGSFNSSADCAAECDATPGCLGTNFGISGGIGCCFLKAFFPPQTSSTTSGYSSYVKGTSSVPWFPAMDLPQSPPSNRSDPATSSSSSVAPIVAGALGGVAALSLLLAVICPCCLRKRRQRRYAMADAEQATEEKDSHQAAPIHTSGTYSGGPLGSGRENIVSGVLSWGRFTYEELRQATDNFSDANLLGEGAFGRVYRAFLRDDTCLAVKQLKSGPKGVNERDFLAEVGTLSRVRHRNLVAFRGYCVTEDGYFLVLDLASSGNLDTALHSPAAGPLSWTERLDIAVAAARGITYLHNDCSPTIVHRDIKAANILLDSKSHALVTDFGLAKLMDDAGDAGTTIVKGSWGYLAPEYALQGQVTKKSDVYSFGVVLLELLTGQRAQRIFPDGRRQNLTDQVLLCIQEGISVPSDPRLRSSLIPPEQAGRLLSIAVACIDHRDQKRPNMSDVLRELEACIQGVPGSSSLSGMSTLYEASGTFPLGAHGLQARVGTPTGTPAASFSSEQSHAPSSFWTQSSGTETNSSIDLSMAYTPTMIQEGR